jgi:hypothetical protein
MLRSSVRFAVAFGCALAFGCSTQIEEDSPADVESAATATDTLQLQCTVRGAVTLTKSSSGACRSCEVVVSGYELGTLVPDGSWNVTPGKYDVTATGRRCKECLAPAVARIKRAGGSCWDAIKREDYR